MVLGIGEVDHEPVLLVVTQASPIGVLKGAPVYIIESIQGLPFSHIGLCESAQFHLQQLADFLRTGFYFSLRYDLTNSMQT
jgi:hypothetical protein